jgi:stringent starvation protein B
VVADREDRLTRLQDVFTALLKHQLATSLGQVEAALGRWRASELGPFEAHAEVLKHAARSERMATRIAQADPDHVGALLRDAFDAGVIERDEFVALCGSDPEQVAPSPGLDEEDEGPALPDKHEFTASLMAEGPVLVHIDARHEEASVPDRFCDDAKLVLRFGYGLSPAIADLRLDDDGLSGTLTFGGVPHHCVLPWASIYAVVSEVDQRGMVWPDDVPGVVLEQMAQRSPAPEPPASAPSAAPPRRGAPHLKLVD